LGQLEGRYSEVPSGRYVRPSELTSGSDWTANLSASPRIAHPIVATWTHGPGIGEFIWATVTGSRTRPAALAVHRDDLRLLPVQDDVRAHRGYIKRLVQVIVHEITYRLGFRELDLREGEAVTGSCSTPP
jgi:hypothetical protein